MRYALLIYGVFDDWVAYTRALKRAGVLVGAERLQVADTATSVRLRAGERLLTDGPYIETKEHLLGFYLVDVADLDAAIDWAARMPHIRRGTVEVRPVQVGMAWQAVLAEWATPRWSAPSGRSGRRWWPPSPAASATCRPPRTPRRRRSPRRRWSGRATACHPSPAPG